MKSNWPMVVSVAACALTVGLLVGSTSTGVLRPARAQSEGVVGRVIAVMGPQDRQYVPIAIVDTLEQTMCIYEYSYTARRLKLVCARTYRYDKQLVEYDNYGPSVVEVRRRVESINQP